MKVLVTGAGGFVGGHLCKRLLDDGHQVVGVDIKPLEDWWQVFQGDNYSVYDNWDLRRNATCIDMEKPEWVFALAADMGGMGFISYNDAQILHNNLLINLNTLEASRFTGVQRYLFTSSVCVYPKQLMMDDDNVPPLYEEDAYPADPADGYGWEKLTAEKLVQAYAKDHGMDARIVRFQNTYGPHGTWAGGREKAPAALCRKVAYSKLCGDDPITIDVWGDGQATRTFMYVDDCVEGLIRLMKSDYQEPLNLGTDELVTVDELAMACYRASEWDGTKFYMPAFNINHIDGPQGHRNRGQDNTRIREVLGWEPNTCLYAGISKTYKWIEQQLFNSILQEMQEMRDADA